MRTPAAFNRIIHKQLARHAAWLPTISPFMLGDYGFFDGGVFRRIGNVKQLGVQFNELPGGSSRLKFRTESGLTVKFFVDGEGEVPQLPATDAEARIEYHYERARSFILNAPTLSSVAIDGVASMAHQISKLPGWRFFRYTVVTELLTADSATLLATSTRGSTLNVSGQANVLRDFHGGKVAAGVTVSSNKSLSLDLVGERGPCALGLIRVKRGGGVSLQATEASANNYAVEAADEYVEPDDDF